MLLGYALQMKNSFRLAGPLAQNHLLWKGLFNLSDQLQLPIGQYHD
jgi:hypothetical protein